jgi:inner membrane protein
MKDVKELTKIKWNDYYIEANPGAVSTDFITSGINIDVELSNKKEEYNFLSNLSLNGSSGLFVSPVGKETNLYFSLNWKNPSFTGDYLPISRIVTDSGFEANWKVLHVNRDFPQKWTGAEYEINNSKFGVSLLPSIDLY